MEALSKLNFQDAALTSREVTNAIMGSTLLQLSSILAFFLTTYVTEPFQFQLVEYAIQQLYDEFRDFADIFFEAITTGEIIFSEPAQKLNFYQFIKDVMEMKLFSTDEWKIRLEPETLKEINLISDCVLFNRKSVRQNTVLLYKQVKYNLLRESNMGYSTLLVKLSNAVNRQAPPEEIVEIACYYLGSFNLDLARVVDILLTMFELNLEAHYEYFLTILSNCPWFEPNGQDDQKTGVELYSTVLGQRFINSQDSTSQKLYHVAALMVKHKLAKLELFYFKLVPSLNDWGEIYKDHLKALRNRRHNIAGTMGEMASDLEGGDYRARSTDAKPKSSDSSNVAKQDAEQQEKPENQRVGLLNALLSIGAYHDSFWILLRQREFLGFDVECAFLMCRLILALLDFRGEFHSKCFAPTSIHGLNAPASSLGRIKHMYPTLTPIFLQPDQEFYYPEWQEEINDDLADQVFLWIRLLGPNIHDNVLFGRLACMAKEPLKSAKDSADYLLWSEILRASLFPSLLVCGGNEGNHNYLWDTLSTLPASERYAFYDDWVYGTSGNSEEAKALLYSGRIVANQLTSRITAENARPFGVLYKTEILRSPGTVFLAILKPIMRYGQHAQYVEVFRFLTKLAADLFHFVLLDLSSDPIQRGVNQPARLKDDCAHVEGWLRNLAQFMGSLCRKYSLFNISTILTYVTNQLHDGNPYDLVFLSELLIKLGGLETHDNLTDLYSLTGGHVLKAEAYPLTLTFLPATPTSTKRLADALVSSRLLPQLIVLLARQDQSVIFSNDISPYTSDADILKGDFVPGLSAAFVQANKGALALPKVLASHTDTIHDVLLRVTELISNHIDPAKLGELLPTLSQFCSDYGVDAALAFGFLRSHLSHLASYDIEAPQPASDEMEQGELVEDSEPTDSPKDVWLTSLQPIAQEFGALFPTMTSNGICSEFYITFWQLRMYDIFVPEEQYDLFLSKLKAILPRGSNGQAGEVDSRIKALEKDYNNQHSLHKRCLSRIQREKSHWFDSSIDASVLASQLVENCILQRCTISSLDALFCAKFLLMLHRLNTPGFSLILVIDHLISHFRRQLYLSTSTEARHFGLMMAELFKPLSRWHENSTVFENEALGVHPDGICTRASRARVLLQQKADLLDGQSLSAFEIFRFQMMEWSCQIFDASFHCLKSCEYMQTHSAFSVLAELEGSFPLTIEHNRSLMQQIEVLVQDKEIKMDSIALGYKAKLIKLRDRCVPAATFSSIYGLIFKPAVEASKSTTGSPPVARPGNHRPSRHHSEQDRHQRNSPSQGQKRLRPEPSSDTRSRPSRDSGHDQSRNNGNRNSRHEQPRDSGRDRRPAPSSSNRDSPGHRDSRNSSYGNDRPSLARNQSPPKRHRSDRGDFAQPMTHSNRASSPTDPRSARQRAENTLSSISGDGFGGERSTRRGTSHSQSGRRVPTGSAANAHLQDNQGRRYNR